MGPPDGNPFASPELAPDGQRVAIGRIIQENADVWQLDAAADVWTRFTDSASGENYPIWAPDGAVSCSRTATAPLASSPGFSKAF